MRQPKSKEKIIDFFVIKQNQRHQQPEWLSREKSKLAESMTSWKDLLSLRGFLKRPSKLFSHPAHLPKLHP